MELLFKFLYYCLYKLFDKSAYDKVLISNVLNNFYLILINSKKRSITKITRKNRIYQKWRKNKRTIKNRRSRKNDEVNNEIIVDEATKVEQQIQQIVILKVEETNVKVEEKQPSNEG